MFDIQYSQNSPTTCLTSAKLCYYEDIFIRDVSVCLEMFPPDPSLVGHGPVLGVKSREPPCSRGDEMLRQREWMCA